MAAQPRHVRSTQVEQLPEPVAPAAPVEPGVQSDVTAELGAEGGSYGELTQSERSRREWGIAAKPQATPNATLAVLFAIVLIVAAILTITFWAMGT